MGNQTVNRDRILSMSLRENSKKPYCLRFISLDVSLNNSEESFSNCLWIKR